MKFDSIKPSPLNNQVTKKRISDLIALIALLPIISVVIAILCLFQKWIQGGTVFFRQERLGLNGKPFFIYKFRTMEAGNEPDAQRLTNWGRFLRSTSLDELPELWNVLIGEMSLVGPRPLPSKYKERYSEEQFRRHSVLPGITGWAQINGRNAISWEKQFQLDCWYVDNHSIKLDLKILFATIGAVLVRKNINEKNQATRSEFLGDESCH